MTRYLLAPALLLPLAACAQTPQPVAPTTEVFADFRARLTQADPTQKGDLALVFYADAPNGEHALIRVPLASTGEAYGEERSCRTSEAGHRELIYTAGLEEANYMEFATRADYKDFHFLLNKYLCRLLAAPFRCDGQAVPLAGAWDTWKLGREIHIDLVSAASARVDTTPIKTKITTVPFDHAHCATIAPSGGFCCVGGHTTEWHCGGTPSTPGWQQVSGECFHRESAFSCRDGDPVPTMPRVWP